MNRLLLTAELNHTNAVVDVQQQFVLY